MDLDLCALREVGYKFARVTPNVTPSLVADFFDVILNTGRRPLAQDSSSPVVPLDPDLLTLAEQATGQSNIIQQIYAEQAERNENRPILGGTSMSPYPRRTGRDEDVIPPAPRGMTPRGDMNYPMNGDQDPDNGKVPMSASTILGCLDICRNGLISQDQENGTNEYETFLSELADFLNEEANGGPPNGDRQPRKRGARDTGTTTGRSTPANGMSGFNGRGSMDRKRAMDSSIAVRSLNQKGFLNRFPMAKHISVRG